MKRRITRARVSAKYQGGNWYRGTVADAEFHAKVYPEPSTLGVDPEKPEERGWSNVSKLHIRKGSEVVYNYDRGCDTGTVEGCVLAVEVVDAFRAP